MCAAGELHGGSPGGDVARCALLCCRALLRLFCIVSAYPVCSVCLCGGLAVRVRIGACVQTEGCKMLATRAVSRRALRQPPMSPRPTAGWRVRLSGFMSLCMRSLTCPDNCPDLGFVGRPYPVKGAAAACTRVRWAAVSCTGAAAACVCPDLDICPDLGCVGQPYPEQVRLPLEACTRS